MLVKEANLRGLSHLKPKAIGCFLAGSLVGRDSHKTVQQKRALAVLARLIDKAIFEYTEAKEAIEAEVKENKMTFQEILKRDEGQYFFTHIIINHLENCITTIARINKIINKYTDNPRKQSLMTVRNSIEHVYERIQNGLDSTPILNISEDSLQIEVAGKDNTVLTIKSSDVADEIEDLYNYIKLML